MARTLPALLALVCLVPCSGRAEDAPTTGLRGVELPTSARLLAWPHRGRRLTAPPPASGPARQTPEAAALPTSIHEAPRSPSPQTAAAAPPPPLVRPSRVRRYSVGREFGVRPDPIALPGPSVLAYSPEVGQAVLAQQERERVSVDPGPMSPADLDLLEQQDQAAERQADRERAREKARRRD